MCLLLVHAGPAFYNLKNKIKIGGNIVCVCGSALWSVFFCDFFLYIYPPVTCAFPDVIFFFEVFFPDSTSVYSLVKPASVLSV